VPVVRGSVATFATPAPAPKKAAIQPCKIKEHEITIAINATFFIYSFPLFSFAIYILLY